MGGIRCARCGHENAAGSRFCGVCGVRVGTVPATEPPAGPPQTAVPPVIAHTGRRTPLAAPPTAPVEPSAGTAVTRAPERVPSPSRWADADGRDGDREAGASLDGSLRLPVSRGARATAIAIVLCIDVALAAAGVLLWRAARSEAAPAVRSSQGSADAGPDAGDAGSSEPTASTAPDAGRPPIAGGPASPGSSPAPSPAAPSAPSPRAPSLPPILGGPSSAPRLPPDAAVTLDDRIRPDAGAPDAAIPLLPDAAELPVPPDASTAPVDPYDEPPPGPADAGNGAGAGAEDDGEPGAGDAAEAVARLISRQQRRFERCYQQAAKAYTPEQPLEGDVDIALRVMPTGDVRDVAAVRNTTGSDHLAQCLVSIISGWRVAAAGGEPVSLVRPFHFAARP